MVSRYIYYIYENVHGMSQPQPAAAQGLEDVSDRTRAMQLTSSILNKSLIQKIYK